MKKIVNPLFRFSMLFLTFSNLGSLAEAQPGNLETENGNLTATIRHLDSLFWKTYNECQTENSGRYLADNVKFYHDKGGLTDGKISLVSSIKNNICGNLNQRIRREEVDGTIHVYPMRNGDSIYGAVIVGEHFFYIKEMNKPEVKTGLAKFTHLWLLQDKEWKMTYILSYDHGPAPYVNTKKEITLSAKELKEFEGNYRNPKFGSFNYKVTGSNLLMDGSGFHSILYPETKNKFFVKDRDLEFEFVGNANNKFYKIVVHEIGAVVDELQRF